MARRGRKRKIGERHPGGQLVDKRPDDRVRTSRQPHRRFLDDEDRFAEQAESPLGRLFLKGRMKEEEEDRITAEELEAGERYAVIVGAYRSVIEAPAGVSGAGGSLGRCEKSCDGMRALFGRELIRCECEERKRRYDEAFEALASAGQRAAKIVARVAVHREEIARENFVYLKVGLRALARHFGLTASRPRDHYQNTH